MLFSVQNAKDEDSLDPRFGDLDLEFWISMPLVIGLSLFAAFQLFASLFILMFNSHNHTVRSTYYASILGMVSSFAIGVYLAIEASELNAELRQYPKLDNDPLPKLMPTYWCYQIGAAASLLFIFPMMAFTFYHKLEKYLALQSS